MSVAEDELTRILHERSLLIDSAPAYRCEPDPLSVRERFGRVVDVRRVRIGLASAVALTAAVVALVTGGWFGTHDRETTSPAVTRCTTAGSPLAAAVRTGLLPVGDRVLSGSADGSALVAVGRPGAPITATAAVDVVDAAGDTSRLWTARAGQSWQAIANPAGAFNNGWAAFLLIPTAGSGAGRAMVVDRSTGHVAELTIDPGYEVGANPLAAPVVVRSAVTVVETSRSNSGAQRLALYWADTARLQADPTTPTSAVTTLLPVGGNVVAIRTGTDRSVAADFDDPRYRPSTLEPAVRHGFGFSSDGTTMHWVSAIGHRYQLWRWAPGDPSPVARTLALPARPLLTTGRFAVAPHELTDAITGQVQNLPAGLSVTRVDGAVATVEQQSPTGVRYARIPASALAGC